MWRVIRNWRRKRLLKHAHLPEALWQECLGHVPTAARLSAADQARLRELATLFVHEKRFEGAHDLQVTDTMRVLIAIQACVLILELGISSYDGWWSVIVYPAAFVSRERYIDEIGVVHDLAVPSDGESWDRGPLVLSWDDAREDLWPGDGHNLIIHECAHKLDLLDGAANGVPRLPRSIQAGEWQRDFERAYEAFCADVERDADTVLDPYAAECPAEFFAMTSEMFFELPDLLQEHYPRVYAHLRAYYRQDPAEHDAP